MDPRLSEDAVAAHRRALVPSTVMTSLAMLIAECPKTLKLSSALTTLIDEGIQKYGSLRKNAGATCKSGKTSCSMPIAHDTPGDDTTLLFVMCASDLNFEANNKYDLTIEATDPGGLTSRSTISVEVSDANEKPRFLGPFNYTVPENTYAGRTFGKPVKAIDIDDGQRLRFKVCLEVQALICLTLVHAMASR